MKRLAAMAVLIALSALHVCAQRGGSHGGFSSSHAGGGFSAPRGGFSSGHGLIAPSSPSFHGGSGSFVRSAPPRFAGPTGPRVFHPQPQGVHAPARSPQYVASRIPYASPRHPVSPASGLHEFNSGTSRRMPYHSPYGGNHSGGWGYHGHGHDGHYHGVSFYSVYGWAGYPYWPWWGWNYPILPASWDYWNDYDSPPSGSYAPSQYPEYIPGPYDTGTPDQAEAQQPEYSRPASPSSQSESATASFAAAPVTLVFKDRRPNEQIHNYLLTSTTLSVLDQNRRDIPVDQLDVPATASLNRKAGVEFSLPGGGR